MYNQAAPEFREHAVDLAAYALDSPNPTKYMIYALGGLAKKGRVVVLGRRGVGLALEPISFENYSFILEVDPAGNMVIPQTSGVNVWHDLHISEAHALDALRCLEDDDCRRKFLG
jgi:hypothetical protein